LFPPRGGEFYAHSASTNVPAAYMLPNIASSTQTDDCGSRPHMHTAHPKSDASNNNNCEITALRMYRAGIDEILLY